MSKLSTAILFALLVFNCSAINKTDRLNPARILAGNGGLLKIDIPLKECLIPMRNVAQDSSGIKVSLVADDGPDYLYI